jgi:hypothetical protein
MAAHLSVEELMTSHIQSIGVGAGRAPTPVNSGATENKPLLSRWLLFVRSFVGPRISLGRKDSGAQIAPANFGQEQKPLMSTPAPALEEAKTAEVEKNKQEMLKALINQQGVATVTTDDSLERAAAPGAKADAFEKAFETKVSGLSGFRARFSAANE